MVASTEELQRIRSEYERRERDVPADLYAVSRLDALFARQQRQRHMIRAFVREGLWPLSTRAILDLGCGEGNHLIDLLSWGASRSKLAGIDLLDTRVAQARQRLGSCRSDPQSGIDLRSGDASHLPWGDGVFDIVHQNTVFTSILDAGMKREVAREAVRVLKPGGVLLWYDFMMDNPLNLHVKGIRRGEIHALFPGCAITLRRTTLAPPLARRLVRVSWIGSLMLERASIFNTHYLGTVRKPVSG
jgi:SAM-dependent methyltransferase